MTPSVLLVSLGAISRGICHSNVIPGGCVVFSDISASNLAMNSNASIALATQSTISPPPGSREVSVGITWTQPPKLPILIYVLLVGEYRFSPRFGTYTHQGGAQCMEHHFHQHEWPWESQENPQHVGKGQNLIFSQGSSQWVPST